MNKIKKWKTQITAVILAGALTLLCGTGLLDAEDHAAADALYQHRSAADGEIVLVGIDDRAIEQFGPYGQWDRDIISMVLEAQIGRAHV